jgi:cysteinyl-tRNA synthetase
VKRLARKGFAYALDGDWFFDISKFRGYGRLSGMRRKPGKGRRISFDDYGKWQAADFILWRRWRKADGKVFWRTALGRGRPGWSIECTAMGAKFLGGRFDVKMGGVDNIFCHHENEIAQAWGVTGKVFAKYFIHVKHLLINGRKMSKSLGNVVHIGDLRRHGAEPMALRLFYLTAHYRRRISFTWKKIRKAQATLGRCRACVAKLKAAAGEGPAGRDVKAAAAKARAGFVKAMDDDLQTGKALDAACGLVDFAAGRKGLKRAEARLILAVMRDFDRTFGMGLFK